MRPYTRTKALSIHPQHKAVLPLGTESPKLLYSNADDNEGALDLPATILLQHHYHLSLNLEGHWDTTGDFATSFLHFSLYSTALWDFVNSRPVHSCRIPACPSLLCFFNRGDTEGTNSSKILCPTFVYVLFYVNLCHDWFCGLWIICGLMTCVQSK